MSDLREIGMKINGMRFCTPREASAILQQGIALLVDLREEDLFMGRRFDVPRLIHIPFRRLHIDYQELPLDMLLIMADYVGKRSEEAAAFLTEHGYPDNVILVGGIVDWYKDGMPTIVDQCEELTGSCACRLTPKKRVRGC